MLYTHTHYAFVHNTIIRQKVNMVRGWNVAISLGCTPLYPIAMTHDVTACC